MDKKALSEKGKKIIKKYKYLMLALLVGLVLLSLPIGSNADSSEKVQSGAIEEEVFDLEEFEERLEKMLGKMEGVGKTSVILTLKSSSERVLAKDKDTDIDDVSQQSSQSTVIVSSGSGYQEVIVVKRICPEFSGALIVCQGGGNDRVALKVTEAVSSLTGLSSGQITVAKMD